MTIRSRLLALLLPPLTVFLVSVSLFFYFNWSHDIVNGSRSRLQSIVMTAAQSISAEEVEWLKQHMHDPHIASHSLFQDYQAQLINLKEKLALTNVYLIHMEPIFQSPLSLEKEPLPKTGDLSSYQTYRQWILLRIEENKPEGSSEINGNSVDLSHVYEPYQAHAQLISAYAPILNHAREIIAFLGADMNTNELKLKQQKAWLIILIGSCITLVCVMSTVFLIAERISQPVRQLNQAALQIAAGDYQANIRVKGPQEILQLGHTLETMSECLVEHISRLKENSLIRERLYGEHECAQLLQYYMLQKVVENFHHSHLHMRLISNSSTLVQKGLLLKVERPSAAHTAIYLFEARAPHFAGLFQLNQWTYLPIEEWKDKAFIQCQFIDHYRVLKYDTHILFSPLVWSMRLQHMIRSDQQEFRLENRDIIFLYGSGLIEHFETAHAIEKWLNHVLRHFSEDGLETISTVLTHELNFLAKKLQTKRDFRIIMMQVNL